MGLPADGLRVVDDEVPAAAGATFATLRAVARMADACNLFGTPAGVADECRIPRGHSQTEQRDYDTIERTVVISLLLAKNEAALAAKRPAVTLPDPFRGYALTVPRAIDLMGAYRDAGLQRLISSAFKNDPETHALLASDVMPHF